MSGSITHYIFGEAIVKEINKKKYLINKENRIIFNIGTQGPDIFFYYLNRIFSKDISNIGSDMHNYGFNLFISSLFDEATKLKNIQKKLLLSYIQGYITHYILDCNTHPYIYYKSGFKTYNKKGTKIKFSLLHHKFENEIDIILLKLFSTNEMSNENFTDKIRLNLNNYDFLFDAISTSISIAYKCPVKNYHIKKSFEQMIKINSFGNFFNNNRLPIFKQNMYITENKKIWLEKNISDIDFFNMRNKTWYKPWDSSKTNPINNNFADMYNNAFEETNHVFELIIEYLNNPKDTKKDSILNFLGNKSFASGMDSSLNLPFKIHESVFYNKPK